MFNTTRLRVLSASLLTAAMLVLSPAAWAMKIQQLDRMADQDQIDYVSQLVARVRASVTGDQLAKVDEFFKARDTGEGVSGMAVFELNLARKRSAELNLAAMGTKLEGDDVERVMFLTLKANGIVLPQSFLTPMSFRPKHPLHRPVSKEVADKWLAQLEAEAERKSRALHGLVHKSADYWSDYRTDVIQQVFDGDFGKNINGDVQFYILYGAYVEQFSASCRAYLPSPHLKRTITRTANGITSTTEIEIDNRFVPKYDEDSAALESLLISNAYGVATGRVSLNTVLDPRRDISTFFSKESCNSAAMRQLGENLLRAANEKPSLQAVGARIAGAAAESDASAPSPRSLFSNSCNAFFSDPKTSRFAPSDPSGYCKCLSAGYRGVMTPAEDAFYASNFKDRFWFQIAEATSTDPAWPRLHPVAESCVQ
jgi:hypothetical protein